MAVSRAKQVTKLEIPVRRAKGSQGNITVQWSLHQNDSTLDRELVWPTSGMIALDDGKWNESFTINVADDKKKAPESVMWVQLDKTSGGALLASRDQTRAKIVIKGNKEPSGTWKWIVIGSACAAFLLLLIILFAWWKWRKHHNALRYSNINVLLMFIRFKNSLSNAFSQSNNNSK